MERPSAGRPDSGFTGELISASGTAPLEPGSSPSALGCNDGSLASDTGRWQASDADGLLFDSEFRIATSHIVSATIFAHFLPLCVPKTPAAQWTDAHKGHAFFADANNYLIDLKVAIIVDVEATRAIRQAEVGAARTMIERTEDRLRLCPERLAADSAYGSAEMPGWLVNEHAIEPHIRCSTSRPATMGRSLAKTSPTIRSAISTSVQLLRC
jgi:hypothetical protein